MSDRRPGDETPKRPASEARGAADDAALRDRLGRLSRTLDEKAPVRGPERVGPPTSDTKGWAQAMRLSSEFIAGILVGGGIGWAADWAFGWSPFGLITFVMLGFAAGILNVLRAMGEISGPGGDRRSPPKDRDGKD